MEPKKLCLIKTKNGRTPLHTACLHGHIKTVELLLQEDLHQINVKDSCGITPFMDALQADQIEICKHIFQNYQIDLYDKDQLGNGYINLTAQSGAINCLKYLFYKYYSDKTNLYSEFKTTLNSFKMTPLHSACKVFCIDLPNPFIQNKIKNYFGTCLLIKS